MITAVILTHNDEKIIKACLESVKWVDEIIIVDRDSNDKTVEIARRHGAKIIRDDSLDFAARRNKAMDQAKGDWVLYIDSDERVMDSLRQEIQELVQMSDKVAYAISRKNFIFGELVDYGPYKNDWMIRLLKKNRFKTWVGSIHEYATFNGDLGYTNNSLVHLTHRDLNQIVLKSLNWTNYDAKLRLDTHHPSMTSWRFLRIFITETWHQLITRKGLFGGTVGMMDSILQVFSFYMSYIRLWELQQKETREQVYKDIDEELMKNNFTQIPKKGASSLLRR